MIYPDVQKAIDVLKNIGSEPFDMTSTAFCIAGYIKKQEPYKHHGLLFEVFSITTGVPEHKSQSVVYPESADSELCSKIEHATVNQAIAMLEILRDTGEVCWEQVLV